MPSPQTLVETWTSGGYEFEVETARWSTETEAQWRARHADAVAYWQGIYPPGLMRNVQRAERRGRRHPGRKALIGGLSGALAACVALVQADSLPDWLQVAGGILGALCVVAFGFLYWPKIKAAIPNGEDL